jgi:hypothetical protein
MLTNARTRVVCSVALVALLASDAVAQRSHDSLTLTLAPEQNVTWVLYLKHGRKFREVILASSDHKTFWYAMVGVLGIQCHIVPPATMAMIYTYDSLGEMQPLQLVYVLSYGGREVCPVYSLEPAP